MACFAYILLITYFVRQLGAAQYRRKIAEKSFVLMICLLYKRSAKNIYICV